MALPQAELFLVFGEEKNQNHWWSVLALDSDLQTEERVADMEARASASYTVVDGSVFVIGGNYSTTVEEYLVRDRRWQKRAPLAVGRNNHAIAVVNVATSTDEEEEGSRKKTLIGIFGGSGTVSSCEVFDTIQDRWYSLPDLRDKREGPAVACIPDESRVFVFGGYNGRFSKYLSSVEFCQLRGDWQAEATTASTADFWLSAAPMRSPRAWLAATPFRGQILVAGGWNGQKDLSLVEVFSPPDVTYPRGQWTEIAAMKEPRWHFTLLASADAVFALGNNIKPGNTVESFTASDGSPNIHDDLTSWAWSSKSPVEGLSRIHGAVIIHM